MTRSNITQRLTLAVDAAAKTYPQLKQRSISPHTIRHTTAMHLLQSGIDLSVIALWLGREKPIDDPYVHRSRSLDERTRLAQADSVGIEGIALSSSPTASPVPGELMNYAQYRESSTLLR